MVILPGLDFKGMLNWDCGLLSRKHIREQEGNQSLLWAPRYWTSKKRDWCLEKIFRKWCRLLSFKTVIPLQTSLFIIHHSKSVHSLMFHGSNFPSSSNIVSAISSALFSPISSSTITPPTLCHCLPNWPSNPVISTSAPSPTWTSYFATLPPLHK